MRFDVQRTKSFTLVFTLLPMLLSAGLLLFARPQVIRLYDLAFPGEGLYDPVLSASFDFWEPGLRQRFPFDCTRSQRRYEVSLAIPEAGSVLSDKYATWPDLAGRFQLTLMRHGEFVLEVPFDGRVQEVRQRNRGPGAPAHVLRLSSFFVEHCDDTSIELRVLEPAVGLRHLRGSGKVIVRVSTEI